MTDDSNFLEDAFRRLLSDLITPAQIRSIESGDHPTRLWNEICESGFLSATTTEEMGGAALSLADVFPLIMLAGEFALPLPFAETMIARGLASKQGVTLPIDAVVVIGEATSSIPCGALASHALVERNGAPTVIEATGAGQDLFRTRGATRLEERAILASLRPAPGAVMMAAAAIASALMAGAMARVFEMTMRYAGERQQFGRSLGKFQAIQQQIAVLAEQVISAQIAARSAFMGEEFNLARVAAAKCRTSEAASIVCSIGHAIHGAIGVTAEYDLQLYTRRIKQWQISFGSETYWAEQLGLLRLKAATPTTADFLRLHLGFQKD